MINIHSSLTKLISVSKIKRHVLIRYRHQMLSHLQVLLACLYSEVTSYLCMHGFQ